MFKKMFGSILIFLFFFSASSLALEIKTGNNIVIPTKTEIKDSLFAAGENITIAGTIKGNLITFGSNIDIPGIVEGTLISFGGKIKITGKAENIYIGGGRVIINGIAKKDLAVAGGQVFINNETRIGKDFFLGCGEANIAGKIYRNLMIGGDNVTISSSALVKGKFDHSTQKINISKNAKIMGSITSFAQPNYRKKAEEFFAKFSAVQMIAGLLSILLFGILIVIFIPNQVNLVASKMIGEPIKSFFWGIFSLIIIPLIAILISITIIGLPIGILLIIAYFLGIYLSTIFLSISIGMIVLGKFKKPDISRVIALLIGLIIINIISFIPIAGGIIKFLLFIWTFGALVATRLNTYREARIKGIY